MKIVPVVLAGGSGTRLWPLSREDHPKQLLALCGEQTMLQETALRVSGVEGVTRPVIVCNADHRFEILEQLQAINISPGRIILEPAGKNTAPAVAAAAILLSEIDTDALMLVLPADHLIKDRAAFHNAVKHAAYFASSGNLLTFGIVPDAPETGYGYIKKGNEVRLDSDKAITAYYIERFVEKPDLQTAESYIVSGDYFWNSGMFLFSSAVVLEELKKYAPQIVATVKEAVNRSVSDGIFTFLDRMSFLSCPSDSIDYAVMEKTKKGMMVPLSAGWSDLGSFASLWEAGPKNTDGNFLVGDVIAVDVSSSLVHSTKRLVAVLGVEDMVVIETPDAVLVMPKHRSQEARKLVSLLKQENRPEVYGRNVTYESWGRKSIEVESSDITVTNIIFNPGARYVPDPVEKYRWWLVKTGSGELVFEKNDRRTLSVGDGLAILPKTHVTVTSSKDPLHIIEVCWQ